MTTIHFAELETARLRLRHFRDVDLPLFVAYRNDPEVARYQIWTTTTEEEARAFIAEQKEYQPTPGQWFQIAIELKEMRILVGDCGVNIKDEDSRQAEIGFTLSRAYQGQGIATEAVTCLLNYLFQTLALHRVIAIADCENVASVALLERLGMRREGHFMQNIWFKGKWGDEYAYAMLREEWLRRGSK